MSYYKIIHYYILIKTLQSIALTKDLIDIPYEEYEDHIASTSKSPKLQIAKDLPIQFPFPFPAIQLCKEKPADDDVYGSLFTHKINLD